MVLTRSANRSHVLKRPATSSPEVTISRKKPRSSPAINKKDETVDSTAAIAHPTLTQNPTLNDVQIVPVPLLFDYSKAKSHLTSVDPRFKNLFDSLRCKPFEDVEHDNFVNPFQSLASSILGQQFASKVSWLAARAIRYRFIRLFFPELPETLDADKSHPLPFPTPQRVAELTVPDLRAAGLSGRKAEYILDLASRFADGRLSASRLVQMDDEELINELVAIRGIGKWTVEMFSIFTLRRPDILPVGDLGIQKGLLKWYTQADPYISVRKLPVSANASPNKKSPQSSSIDTGLTTPQTDSATSPHLEPPSTPVKGRKLAYVPPTPCTPGNGASPQKSYIPKHCTLSLSALKQRLTKPIKNGVYLTPAEMEELTCEWAPYRSVGIWYLWSLADGKEA